jgi:hypothetical protein
LIPPDVTITYPIANLIEQQRKLLTTFPSSISFEGTLPSQHQIFINVSLSKFLLVEDLLREMFGHLCLKEDNFSNVLPGSVNLSFELKLTAINQVAQSCIPSGLQLPVDVSFKFLNRNRTKSIVMKLRLALESIRLENVNSRFIDLLI